MSKKRKYGPRMPHYAAGIRLQEQRVSASRCWWAKEWTARVSEMQFGVRLGLAKAYAQAGQVVNLELAGGVVTAEVMGARTEPYRVRLDFRPVGEVARRRIEARLTAEPMLVARMLAGELPQEVEEIFRREGFSLFPGGKVEAKGRKYDVEIGCSCPDWANPCKHATAVLLILGEYLAGRPIEYLRLRGVEVPLAQEPVDGVGTGGAVVAGEVLPRLGAIPFWRGERRVLPELEKLYKSAMARAAASGGGR